MEGAASYGACTRWCVLILCFFVSGHLCTTKIPDDLRNFLSVLEPYQSSKNDIVFVLDESGSIGADIFPQVVRFTEMVARLLPVSPNENRVAVITFATVPRTHIDYIGKQTNGNMCTFLAALEKIDYAAQYTHTGDALIVAKDILAHSRANVPKIIILLTDGRSNGGYNLLDISNTLKQSGVIIFAVGVADVNEQELVAVATSPSHIYILKEFSFIHAFNDFLKNDTKEVSYDYAGNNSLCNHYCTAGSDCCDVNAACVCGTKGGQYECACKSGFQGDGHKGTCRTCAKGTYKGDNSVTCKPCPANSTTLVVGSQSIEQCECIFGHEGSPRQGKPCKPVECVKLRAPKGGVILPSTCGNTYGSKCTFRCLTGYCPYMCNKADVGHGNADPWSYAPTEARQCLENQLWSGPDFHCEKIKCSSLDFPKHGNHNCSATDFSFGTVCQMMCDKGFSFSGSEFRTCLANGSWTGSEASCYAQKCKKLKVNADLRIKPKICSSQEMDYGSACQYFCRKGYKLTSPSGDKSASFGIRHCELGGKWSDTARNIICEDAEPPSISCPDSRKEYADFGKGTATVRWDMPLYSDNSAIDSVKIIHPGYLRKPPHAFNIGEEKIVYQATDSSGLKSTCSFTVTVIDNQPPQVIYCPANIEVVHGNRSGIPVTWKEPKFADNSGSLREVKKSRENGSMFHWGPSNLVTYTAIDGSGNVANCSFSVAVKAYSCPYSEPPKNGFLACDQWSGGQFCGVSCKDGFAFPAQPEPVYFCSQKSRKWQRLPGRPKTKGPLRFPWPDCAKIRGPKYINVSISMKYNVSDCSAEDTTQVKQNFIKALKAKHESFCPKNKGCHVANVTVICKRAAHSSRRRRSASEFQEYPIGYASAFQEESSSGSDHANYGAESSRGTRSIQEDDEVLISFDILVAPLQPQDNATEGTCENCTQETNTIELYEHGIDLTGDLKPVVDEAVQEAYDEPDTKSTYFQYETVPACRRGEVLKNKTCVDCAVGTYYNESSNDCAVCPVGFFQDVEGSLSCKECPHGTLTLHSRSRKPEDCRGPCKPGFHSSNGIEPCEPCRKDTYQDKWGSKYCLPCRPGLFTSFTGASSPTHCITPCDVGSFSENGLVPCLSCPFGTYQPVSQMTSCIKCPLGTLTAVEGASDIQYCQTINFCEDFKPCATGSTCRNANESYVCSCLRGFAGKDCDLNVNDCTSDSCENNGTCVDGINGFSCLCQPGSTGTVCEQDIDDCESDPCGKYGSCRDLVNDYECECVEGFNGRNCEFNIDDCEPNPCQNGGKCFDMKNDFRCCCPEGFTGHTCNVEVDKCQEVECMNGGTCVSSPNDFNCSCIDGFAGTLCEVNIDDCVFDVCLNGGTCVDGVNNVTCQCPFLYAGQHCEEALSTDFSVQFPSPVTSNYVELQNERLLRAVTLSFFMRTNYTQNRGTPISYSYYNSEKDILVENAITLFDVNKILLFLHGEMIHTGYVANSDQEWHHYAVTWENVNGSWSFYVDGRAIVEGLNVAQKNYLHPGVFIVGQEQDSLGGTFSILEAFVGEITELNVWDYAFTLDGISRLSGSCGFLGNVIAWPSVQTHLHGNLIVDHDNELCKTMKSCMPEDDCNCNADSLNFLNLGYKCKHVVNHCSANTCKNDQKCIDIDNDTSVCACHSGYDGKLCEYDVNECLINNGNCSHSCVNTVGSYECTCPDGMKLRDNYNCMDTSFCEVDGQTFLDGETWKSSCNECLCELGLVLCQEVQCPNVTCEHDEDRVLLPGQCCETCVSTAACHVYPNNSVVTFDQMHFDFHGNCRYTFVKDCVDGQFTVEFEQHNYGGTEKLTVVHVLCTEVEISPEGHVAVNKENVTLPFRNTNVFIEEFETLVRIWTRSSVAITWYPSGLLAASAPHFLSRQLCGLCGNFNSNPKDDLAARQLSVAKGFTESDCFPATEDSSVTQSSVTLWQSGSRVLQFICFTSAVISLVASGRI